MRNWRDARRERTKTKSKCFQINKTLGLRKLQINSMNFLIEKNNIKCSLNAEIDGPKQTRTAPGPGRMFKLGIWPGYKVVKNLGPNRIDRTSDYAVRESLLVEWCIGEKLRSLLAWNWGVLKKSVWSSLVGSSETSRKLFESKSSIFSSHFHD